MAAAQSDGNRRDRGIGHRQTAAHVGSCPHGAGRQAGARRCRTRGRGYRRFADGLYADRAVPDAGRGVVRVPGTQAAAMRVDGGGRRNACDSAGACSGGDRDRSRELRARVHRRKPRERDVEGQRGVCPGVLLWSSLRRVSFRQFHSRQLRDDHTPLYARVRPHPGATRASTRGYAPARGAASEFAYESADHCRRRDRIEIHRSAAESARLLPDFGCCRGFHSDFGCARARHGETASIPVGNRRTPHPALSNMV